jgi:uncharacterized membrane protein HdeD (DUF308 family)
MQEIVWLVAIKLIKNGITCFFFNHLIKKENLSGNIITNY